MRKTRVLPMAVVFGMVHYWNHRDIELELFERVRKTYDGPLTMADDLAVLNVTIAEPMII